MKANFYRGFICLLHSLHSPPALGSPEASVGKEKGFLPTQLCQEGRAGRAMRACKFGQNILIPPPHSGPAIVADLAEVDILTEKDAGFKHINTAVFKGFLDRKPGTILLERCFARFCQLRHILLKCPDIEVLGRRRGTFRKYFAITPPPSPPPPWLAREPGGEFARF